jgi:glycyl-tRNA synthetase alpha subunit
LGLASHANLERLVSGLLQHCELGLLEEYWSSQTVEIQQSLDLKYGAVGTLGRKAAM